MDAFAFSVVAVVLELFCAPFPAFLGFSSSSLELSAEVLLLVEAAAFFPTVVFAAPVDLVAGFTAGFFSSSSLLELSESEVPALGAGAEGLDTGLPTLPTNLAGMPFFFFSSSELLELLSESELLCAFFVAACDFFVAGVAPLVVGFTGAFLSELSESRLERKIIIKAKLHSFNMKLTHRFNVDTQCISLAA